LYSLDSDVYSGQPYIIKVTGQVTLFLVSLNVFIKMTGWIKCPTGNIKHFSCRFPSALSNSISIKILNFISIPLHKLFIDYLGNQGCFETNLGQVSTS